MNKSTMSILFSLLLPLSALAETLVVATDTWEGYTNEDGSGYYLDIIRKAYPDADIDIKYVPFARSVKMLAKGNAHIVLGVYKGDLEKGIYSESILEQDLVDGAVSKDLAANWQGAESMAGKKVVAKIDYAFDSITDVPMDYSEKAYLDSMLKMLAAGRVDVVLDYKADIRAAQSQLGGAPNYEIIEGVLSAPIYFGFVSGDKGEALRQSFDKAVAGLVESGELRQMMIDNTGTDKSYPY